MVGDFRAHRVDHADIVDAAAHFVENLRNGNARSPASLEPKRRRKRAGGLALVGGHLAERRQERGDRALLAKGANAHVFERGFISGGGDGSSGLTANGAGTAGNIPGGGGGGSFGGGTSGGGPGEDLRGGM